MLPIKLTSKTTPQQAAAVTHAARQAAGDVPWPLVAACMQRVTRAHTVAKAVSRAQVAAQSIPANASPDWLAAFAAAYGRTQTVPAAKAKRWADDYELALAALQQPVGPPAPPEVRKYRQQQPLLFHRYKELVTPLIYTTAFPVVEPPEPVPTKAVYVAAMLGAARAERKGWRATVTVTVRDAAGVAVPGAVVSGGWTTGGRDVSCTTGVTGACSITTGKLSTRTSSTTFAVSGITGAGLRYDPLGNVSSRVTVTVP